MKKITSILLAIMLILGVCGSAMLTIGAEEATSDTWDGTASIKWYLDGTNADGEYELKTAEDLAGLAFLVGAAQTEGRYTGVYYRADGTVVGYKAGSNDTSHQVSSLIASSTEGLECVNGDSFLGKVVVLTVDVVLNEGNAADWATTAPTNVWQPIGGNIINGGKRAAFDGNFDGRGHTVSGLYYKSTVDFGGLFGATGQQFPATIQNLKVTNFYVNGKEECGALVGRSGKGLTVSSVQISNGIVEATDASSAAMLGTVFGGPVTFRNSSVENVKVQSPLYLGIFTGMEVAQTVEINDCYVKDSSVKGEAQAGLICGRAAGGGFAIHNLYAIVDVEATGTVTEGSRIAGAGLVYAAAGDSNKPNMGTIEGFYHVGTVVAADETLINADGADLVVAVELSQITGDTAKTTLTGFDFETVWKAVEGGTPVIELRGDVGGGNTDDDDFLPEDDGSSDDDDDDTSNKNNKNDKTETTETKDNAGTTDATTADKKGCGSVVGFAGLALMAVLSGAAVMLKKED